MTVTMDQVERVYSGKANRCFCGCSGKYTEKTDKSFKMMATKVLALVNEADGGDNFGNGTSVEVGERVYAVYFKEV